MMPWEIYLVIITSCQLFHLENLVHAVLVIYFGWMVLVILVEFETGKCSFLILSVSLDPFYNTNRNMAQTTNKTF